MFGQRSKGKRIAPATAHKVRVHPGLAAAALLSKTDRLYRLWALARAMDVDGRGIVHVAQLQAHVGDVAGLGSRQSVNRLIDAGVGMYWHLEGRLLRLAGLAALCSALDVPRIKNPAVVDLPASLGSWRALLVFVGFAGDRFKVCSQRVIGEATGRTGRTIRNYRACAGSWLATRKNAAPLRAWDRGDPVPEGCYVDQLAGGLVLFKCLPNSYRAGLTLAGRGNVRSTNKQLASPAAYGGGGQRASRLFFDDRKAANAAKALQGMGEGDTIFLALHTTNRSGAVLWGQRTMANGRLWGG